MASATDFHSIIKDMFTGGGSSASSTTSITSTFEGLNKDTRTLLDLSMKHFSRVEKLLEEQTKVLKNQNGLGISDLVGANLITKIGGWVFTRLGITGAVESLKNFVKLGTTRLGKNIAEFAGGLGETVVGAFKKIGTNLGVVGSKFLNIGEKITRPFKDVLQIFSTGGLGKVFSGIGEQFGRLSNLLKLGTFTKFLGKLAWPITAIFGLYDGITGWTNASQILGRDVKGIGGKVISAVGSIINGLLFGIPDWVSSKFNMGNLSQVLDRGWNIGSNLFIDTSQAIVNGVLKIGSVVTNYIVDGYNKITKSLPSMEDIWKTMPNLGQYLYDTFGAITKTLKDGIFGLRDSILDGIKGFFKDTYDGIKNWFQGKDSIPSNRPSGTAGSPATEDGYYRVSPGGVITTPNPMTPPSSSPISPGGNFSTQPSPSRQSTGSPLGTTTTPNTSPISFSPDASIDRPTVGMKNRNPGNIKYNPTVKWEGLVGPSTNLDQGDPQAVFSSDEAGMRAMAKLARNKYNSGMKTVSDIIGGPSGWTPGATFAVNNIAKTMGVDPNEEINLNDDKVMKKFMRAVIKQEHGAAGNNYSDELIDKGISLSYKGSNWANPVNDNPIIPTIGGAQVTEAQSSAGIRKQAIQPGLKSRISETVTRTLGEDYEARVYSGGQPSNGIAGVTKTGSNRHNEGHAGDVMIFNKKTGQQISQDEYARVGQAYIASGYGSVGMQMATGGIHLDDFTKDKLGKGQSLTWTYDSKGGIPLTPSAKERLQQGVAGVLPEGTMSYDDYVKKYSVNKVTTPITPQSVNDAAQSKGVAPSDDESTPYKKNTTPVPSYDDLMKAKESSPDDSKTKVGDVSSVDETKMLLVNGAMWG